MKGFLSWDDDEEEKAEWLDQPEDPSIGIGFSPLLVFRIRTLIAFYLIGGDNNPCFDMLFHQPKMIRGMIFQQFGG